MSKKNPVGKPLAFKTVEDLEEAINNYFQKPDSPQDLQEPWRSAWDVEFTAKGDYLVFRPTISGLAVALGVDRKTINNYTRKEEYFPTIKKAKAMIETVLEKRLYGQAVTGLIFNLKNNFEWKDKTETDITTGGDKVPSFTVIPVNPDGTEYTP